jgi:5'-nucleotidase
MSDKPLDILVCNDDSVHAKGIQHLVAAVKPFGRVTVVAPDSPQSGMGHAISVGKPLRLNRVHLFGDVEAYECSGTPVDSVKLATGVVLKHKPDLIVSGINHGLNASISVFYSGTMSAAVEGAIEGIPSIGFSLDSFDANADFSACEAIVAKIVQQVLQNGLPPKTALNVNIPYLPLPEIRGIQITHQAFGRFVEEFEHRVDPYGRDYYWLSGRFALEEEEPENDIVTIRNGYVSVCPVEIDATAHHHLTALKSWALGLG